MKTKEFQIICGHLDEITKGLKNLNERMEILEGKTDEIHESVPFVRWLEDVGRAVSYRLTWLGVSKAPAKRITCDTDTDPNPS